MSDEKTPKASEAPEADDIFDLQRLRIAPDFAEAIGVKKLVLTVPVKKPERQWFVQVHPSPDYRLSVALLELRDDRVAYVVDPALAAALPGDVRGTMLFTAINRQGTLFLWPVKLPGEGRQEEWSRSALEAAELAQTQWVKVVANMGLGAYEVSVATATLPEPEWPDLEFKKIIEIAFKDKIIRRPDHPALRRLRGEI
jgi:hypothetical protein